MGTKLFKTPEGVERCRNNQFMKPFVEPEMYDESANLDNAATAAAGMTQRNTSADANTAEATVELPRRRASERLKREPVWMKDYVY